MRDHRMKMHPHSLLLLLLLLLCLCFLTTSSEDIYTQYFQVARPLPTDYYIPLCSLTLLSLTLTPSSGAPALSSNYTPPSNCSSSAVVLQLSASSSGRHPPRVGSVWLSGVELLRTSTVQTVDQPALWNIRKDVTKYTSVLSRPTTASLLLQNVRPNEFPANHDDSFNGTLQLTVSLLFYPEADSVETVALDDDDDEKSDNLSFRRKLGALENSNHGNSQIPWKLDSHSEPDFDEGGDEEQLLGDTKIEIVDEEDNFKDFDELGIQNSRLEIPSRILDSTNGSLDLDVLHEKPADLIIPISDKVFLSSVIENSVFTDSSYTSWFVISNGSDIHSKLVRIPNNTYKAVLEIYASPTLGEEFWYSNPPSSPYISMSNLTIQKLNSAFRQVFAVIDSSFAGLVVPFPTVYSGAINSLFWQPIVPIGSFDFPSYDLDLTPFLGLLLDGKPHSLGLGVADAAPSWLVGANLHLWLDHGASQTTAGLVEYRFPPLSYTRKFKYGSSETEFQIEAKRVVESVGWVNSSFGNLTTSIRNSLKFKNEIEIKQSGLGKEIDLEINQETEVAVASHSGELLARAVINTEYPLELEIETRPNWYGELLASVEFNLGSVKTITSYLASGSVNSTLKNKQECEGRNQVNGILLLPVTAETEQKLTYRDDNDCYSRKVESKQGILSEDNLSNICKTED